MAIPFHAQSVCISSTSISPALIAIAGINVSKARVEMGRELARRHPVEADLVIPVPDSGVYAALGYSEELGIPTSRPSSGNHYIGRTFIQPTQRIRDFNVRVN